MLDKFYNMDEANILKKQVKKYIDAADEKVVKMVFAMLEVNAEEDWWDELSPEEEQSIERGLEDIEHGKVIPHKEVMKKYKKWLT